MKVDGIPFKNSDTCEGTSFTSQDASLDISIITITGRYPEIGWAMNQTVHEIVYLDSGQGSLELETGEVITLNPGEVVSVKPDQWFAWNGNMKLIMACQPAFDPKQYKLKEQV